MAHDNNPLKAQRIKVVHTYRDISGHNKTVSNTTRTITAVAERMRAEREHGYHPNHGRAA